MDSVRRVVHFSVKRGNNETEEHREREREREGGRGDMLFVVCIEKSVFLEPKSTSRNE